ncbi:MAG TPA: hypothetical protein VN025_14015 [Candidatus Dormibacteraeota bacterium]|nr:hypothetical protein [Candidatus Dormibacteraeota bacterium]
MNKSSWFWPDVSAQDGAKNACRGAMWCAILVAGLTTVVALLALSGVKSLPIDGSALIDAAIFGGIAFGLSRCSRFAGVAGFALFLFERIYLIAKVGFFMGGGILGIVLLLGFFNGMRGAFAYKKLQMPRAVPLTSPPFS